MNVINGWIITVNQNVADFFSEKEEIRVTQVDLTTQLTFFSKGVEPWHLHQYMHTTIFIKKKNLKYQELLLNSLSACLPVCLSTTSSLRNKQEGPTGAITLVFF
jgi:hypothetical protein